MFPQFVQIVPHDLFVLVPLLLMNNPVRRDQMRHEWIFFVISE